VVKQLKDFEGIVLLKQDATGWEDTLYLYAVDIPSLNIKQCGALIMSKYYVQSILNLQAPLDRMIPVYPIDYRTEQNFKGTEIEKQKLDDLLLLVAKAIGIKLFLNREIPEVLVLPWNTLEDELKKQKN
jgi:hypothetical protein